MRTIVLDSGHGKTDRGSTAVDGIQEAVFNWELTRTLGDYMRQHYYVKIIYTHEGPDTALSPTAQLADELKRRADKANGARADLLISLHHDAAGDPAVRGGSLYIWRDVDGPGTGWAPATGYHTDPKSYPIATTVVKPVRTLLESFGIPWRSLGDPGGIACADFGILRNTAGPAVLLEAFHGTNTADTEAARRPDFIPQLARTLGDALAKALDLPALVPLPLGAIEFDGIPLDVGAKNVNGTMYGQLRKFGVELLRAYSIDPLGVIGYDPVRRCMVVKTRP